MDERVKILANSCFRNMNRIGMRRSRKSCAARPREGWRHAFSVCIPGAKLRYARNAANERWRSLLREYSHWKRCRQAVFKKMSRHSVTAAMGDDNVWFLEEEMEEKEEDELLLLILTLNNKRQRKWVYEMNLARAKYGEYLMQMLEDDEEKFQQYFRLSPAQFNKTLALIEQNIKKQDTNYRKSITAEERLAITLR